MRLVESEGQLQHRYRDDSTTRNSGTKDICICICIFLFYVLIVGQGSANEHDTVDTSATQSLYSPKEQSISVVSDMRGLMVVICSDLKFSTHVLFYYHSVLHLAQSLQSSNPAARSHDVVA